MRKRFIWLLLLLGIPGFPAVAGIVIGSWNLQHLGRRKTVEQIEIIARTVQDFDLVALQEIPVNPDGAQALGRLMDCLNRGADHWDFVISEPTSGSNLQERERYAFVWKTAKVRKKGVAALASVFENEISREPFVCTFTGGGIELTLVNFHALPRKKQPEKEIHFLQYFQQHYQDRNLVFLGDFNCPQSHNVFSPLKLKGYKPVLKGQKTTLRQDCVRGDCLASEYDNIFYTTKAFRLKSSGIVPFHRVFNGDMRAARRLSDHLPVFAEIE